MARSPFSRSITAGLVKLSPTRPMWRSLQNCWPSKVTMPAASWPRCCSACRPSAVSARRLRVAENAEDAALLVQLVVVEGMRQPVLHALPASIRRRRLDLPLQLVLVVRRDAGLGASAGVRGAPRRRLAARRRAASGDGVVAGRRRRGRAPACSPRSRSMISASGSSGRRFIRSGAERIEPRLRSWPWRSTRAAGPAR